MADRRLYCVAPVLCLWLSGAAAAPLRVCADPDGMPYSNAKGEGFENAIADVIAHELGRPLAYSWVVDPARNARAALASGNCDLVMGVPAGADHQTLTRPYYWSDYVLISRTDRRLAVDSLQDPRLRSLKIGVVSVGGDELVSPPARVLTEFGLGKNLVAYPIDDGPGGGDRRARLIAAVADGAVDVAAVWGPLAGYFVKRAEVPLTVTPISDTDEFSARKPHFQLMTLQYEIAMAVSPGNEALRAVLDRTIEHARPRIEAVLDSYGVPLIRPTRIADAGLREARESGEAP